MVPYPSHEASLDRPVRITPYDPQWPARYQCERAALAEAIGEWTVSIDHVGSTAIRGVDAEPVIDILAGASSPAACRACFEPLAQLDYLPGPGGGAEMHSFCKPYPGRRVYDLHLVPVQAARYSEMLAFRDFLRAERQAAIGYAGLKRDLAGRYAADRQGYTAAKGELIEAVLARL